MALKSCVRAVAEGAWPNFRESKLTQLLKNCFVDPAAATLVVSTVSPASMDTEYSLSTLQVILNGLQHCDLLLQR